MQNSEYIFSIQNKDHAFWQPDNSGGITISNKPYFLDFAPAGWENIEIVNIRNKKYFGVDRSVSIPLQYVKDGAQIIKHILYNLGIEETVYLTIAKQEIDYTPGESYGFWFKQIYRGEIDLSTFIHNGATVTCTTLEDGLPKFLRANENTVYELPMDVPDAIRVKMDGIRLHEKLNFGLSDGVNYVDGRYIPSFSFLNNEGNSTGIIYLSQTYEQVSGTAGADNTYVATSGNFFFQNQNSFPVTINISGAVKFISNRNDTLPASSTSLKIKSDKSNGFGGTVEVFIFSMAPVEGVANSVTVDVTLTVDPQEKLFMFGVTGSVNSTLYNFEYLPDSLLNVSFITRQKTTYIRGLKPQYIFEQLVNRVTEGKFTAAVSNYFATHSNIIFTCGNSIRGLDDAVMKISFSDFFQFWDCFDSVGMTEKDGKVNIDKKQQLIDRTNVIQLQPPGAGTFKISIAKDYLFNELEIGYPEIRNEVGLLNGNEEFNCKFLFSTGATKSPAKLDKVSKVKASCYEIELIRVTTFAKETTDNKADNDLFVLHVDNTLQPAVDVIPAHYQLDRVLNATASGLVEALTVFNLFLSPKRNLLRNGEFIRSSLFLSDGKILAYKSSDKNNKVVCNGVTEKADVSVGSLGSKFFYPVLLDGNFPAPDNLISLLDLNPLQVFGFSVDGNYYEGVLNKVSISPASRKDQAYQFYSVQDNDLSKLEFYYGG